MLSSLKRTHWIFRLEEINLEIISNLSASFILEKLNCLKYIPVITPCIYFTKTHTQSIAARFRKKLNDFDDQFHARIVYYPSALSVVLIVTWVVL